MDTISGHPPCSLSSFGAIWSIANPAALFRVSSVLSAALQTSIVSLHGGSTLLAAFAATGVTIKAVCMLFAFMLDGVTAKVGRSAAHEAPAALHARVRLYFLSCLALGAAAAGVLVAGREAILAPFHLSPVVHEAVCPYWDLMALLVPLMLLNLAISGSLQGMRRVGLSAALEAASAAAEVAGAYWVLTMPWLPASRLCALAWAKWAVNGFTSALGMAVVAALLPKTDLPEGQAGSLGHTLSLGQSGRVACQGRQAGAPEREPLLSNEDDPEPLNLMGTPSSMSYLRELVRDGLNMMARSVLVQGSVWLVAVAAAQLGTASLAAHQILTQLWTLPTHLSGGFAVAGIVLGSRLSHGQGQEGQASGASQVLRRAQRRLSMRLLLLSSCMGAAAGAGLAAWRSAAASVFHPSADVAQALHGPAWAMLCVLQPITSALFTATGLIYGAHYFAFMRNVLLVGFLGLFCPSLLWVVRQQQASAGGGGWGLGAVWAVKLAFYLWQLAAEGWGVARAYGFCSTG